MTVTKNEFGQMNMFAKEPSMYMTKEDLERYGLEPMMKKVLRQDIPTYIDSDTDLNNILLKKMLHQEIVDFCGSVLKEINNRTWQLRSFIEWEKFTSGG